MVVWPRADQTLLPHDDSEARCWVQAWLLAVTRTRPDNLVPTVWKALQCTFIFQDLAFTQRTCISWNRHIACQRRHNRPTHECQHVVFFFFFCWFWFCYFHWSLKKKGAGGKGEFHVFFFTQITQAIITLITPYIEQVPLCVWECSKQDQLERFEAH